MPHTKAHLYNGQHPLGAIPVYKNVSKEQNRYKSNEDKLRNEITKTEKCLQRYRKTEKYEMEKLIPILERTFQAESSCFETVGALLKKCANVERWHALSKKYEEVIEAIFRYKLQMFKMGKVLANKEIENQINLIDNEIETENSEGHTLINYACISYAEMVETIEYMNECHKQLKTVFNRELFKLREERKEFEAIMLRRLKRAESHLKLGIRQEMNNVMDYETRQMEKTNEVLRGAIDRYKNEVLQREQAVKTLSEEIKVFKKNLEIEDRKALFPEIFSLTANCTPDMELELDIPIKTNIPI